MFSESPDRPLHLMSVVQSDVSLLLIYYRRSPERSFNLAECGTAQNPVRHVLWTDKHLLAGPWHHCMISSWAMLLKADLSENHVWACPSPSFRRAASCSATDRLMLWCPTHFCSFSMFIWIFYIDTTSQENVMFCTRLQNRKKLYKNVWLKLCQTPKPNHDSNKNKFKLIFISVIWQGNISNSYLHFNFFYLHFILNFKCSLSI